MRLLKLSNNAETIIDKEDYPFLNKWKWKQHPQGYACRTSWDAKNKKWICILIHRLLLKAKPGQEVHHKNGNKLDNRKSNLKVIVPRNHRIKHITPLIESAKRRQIYPDYKNCIECGKEFKVNPRKRKRHKTCSKQCAQAIRVRGMMKARNIW